MAPHITLKCTEEFSCPMPTDLAEAAQTSQTKGLLSRIVPKDNDLPTFR